MFLSKLFKHTRARVVTALAGMAMIVGAGAAITHLRSSSVSSREVSADATTVPNICRIYFGGGTWSASEPRIGTQNLKDYWGSASTFVSTSTSSAYAAVSAPSGCSFYIDFPLSADNTILYFAFKENSSTVYPWNGNQNSDYSGYINEFPTFSKGHVYKLVAGGWDHNDGNNKWSHITGTDLGYIAAFNVNGGKRAPSVNYDYMEARKSLTTPAAPSKYSSTFAGWKINSTTYSAGQSVTLSAPGVFTAQWNEASTKSFYLDCGKISSSWVPYVYIWDGNDNKNATFPGVAAEKTSRKSIYNNATIYSITVPINATGMIISTSSGDSGSYKTSNIEDFGTDGQTYLVLSHAGKGTSTGGWYDSVTLTTNVLTNVVSGAVDVNTYYCYSGVAFDTPSLPVRSYHDTLSWYTTSAYTTKFTATSITTNTNIYAKYLPNLFMIGGGIGTAENNWEVRNAIRGSSPMNNNNVVEFSNVYMKAGAAFKFVLIVDYDPASSEIDEWKTVTLMGNAGDVFSNGGSSDFDCSTEGYYDAYIQDDNGTLNVWFVNEGAKDSYGYLYIPYGTDTDVRICTYNSLGAELIKGSNIWTAVPSYTVVDEVSFLFAESGTSSTKLARFKIYDLRGTSSDAAVTFKLSVDGGSTWSSSAGWNSTGAPIEILPGTPDLKHVYFTYGYTAVSYPMGSAARALFEIKRSIDAEGKRSICGLTPGTATELVRIYDEVSSDDNASGYFHNSTITTYALDTGGYSKVTYPTTPRVTPVAITAIYDVLKKIKNGTLTQHAIVAGARSQADSPLTTTLWIVLGAGLAGLTAIGTAYFVSKKKKRYQA